MTIRRWLTALAVVAGCAAPAWAAPSPAPLTVFAAASLKNGLDAVDAAYTAHTGQPVRVSYAASSALAHQIEQGAPAQVFLSADSDWMDDVAQHGLIEPQTRRDLLTNHLALIAPASSAVQLRLAPGVDLVRSLGRTGRLAMAGPEVPAGRYGRQALAWLHAWPAVQPRVVYGDSVRAALAFVDRGEAPLGVVYDTDARIDPGVRIVALFPEESHARIVYPTALVRPTNGPDAHAYLDFLQGPQAAALFRRFGFATLPR